jgi:hypothetical protein
MAKYQRDNLLRDLVSNVVEVTFTKVNGETRIMRCTLDPNHLPSNYNKQHLEEMHQKPENLNTIAAWDIQANGWRSFRVENVEYAQIIDSY